MIFTKKLPIESRSWSTHDINKESTPFSAHAAKDGLSFQAAGTFAVNRVVHTQTSPASEAGKCTAVANLSWKVDCLQVNLPPNTIEHLTFRPRSLQNPWLSCDLPKPATQPVGWCLKSVSIKTEQCSGGGPMAMLHRGGRFDRGGGEGAYITKTGWQRLILGVDIVAFRKNIYLPLGIILRRPKQTVEPLYKSGMKTPRMMMRSALLVTKGDQDPRKPTWIASDATQSWRLTDTFGQGHLMTVIEGDAQSIQDVTLQIDCVFQRFLVVGTGRKARYQEECVGLHGNQTFRVQLPSITNAALVGAAVGALTAPVNTTTRQSDNVSTFGKQSVNR